jgi:hypothetical protein
MLTPILVGMLFGTRTLAGVLAGALVSGVQMAVSMSNTGGAWDNAKKYIEVRQGQQQYQGGRLPAQGGWCAAGEAGAGTQQWCAGEVWAHYVPCVASTRPCMHDTQLIRTYSKPFLPSHTVHYTIHKPHLVSCSPVLPLQPGGRHRARPRPGRQGLRLPQGRRHW